MKKVSVKCDVMQKIFGIKKLGLLAIISNRKWRMRQKCKCIKNRIFLIELLPTLYLSGKELKVHFQVTVIFWQLKTLVEKCWRIFFIPSWILLSFLIYFLLLIFSWFREKQLAWKAKVSFKIYDVINWETNNNNTHIAQYLEK